jgi:hypothetical protein
MLHTELLQIRQFSRPPQGTHEIQFNPGKHRWCHTVVSGDSLWPLIAREYPDSAAWIELCNKHGNFTVGMAYRFWRNPESLA